MTKFRRKFHGHHHKQPHFHTQGFNNQNQQTTDQKFNKANFIGSSRGHRPFIPWIWINILTIILIPIIMSIVLGYIPYNNSLMKIVSFILFIAMAFIVGRATYYILRKLNRINLMSDLSLWLLKLFSVIMILFSAYFFIVTVFAGFLVKVTNPYAVYTLLYLAVVVFVIGVFGAFRSKRRQNIIGIWQ